MSKLSSFFFVSWSDGKTFLVAAAHMFFVKSKSIDCNMVSWVGSIIQPLIFVYAKIE